MKLGNYKVDILLATYNGEHYLPELLDSLIKQTYSNFRILIRDDGSSDGTLEIIKNYSELDKRIEIINDNMGKAGGAARNFSFLLTHSTAQYIMFCDQDDIWLDNKVEKTLKAMIVAEKKYPRTPILVHSDLVVVDDNKRIICESFFKNESINPKRKKLCNFFVLNTITGCTVMINRLLREKINGIEYAVTMHDNWMAMCAASFGKIITINKPLIYYRQHQDNSVGAYETYAIIHKINVLKHLKAYKEMIMKSFDKVALFEIKYRASLSIDDDKMCNMFVNLKKMKKIEALKCIFNNDFYRARLYNKLLFWFMICIL